MIQSGTLGQHTKNWDCPDKTEKIGMFVSYTFICLSYIYDSFSSFKGGLILARTLFYFQFHKKLLCFGFPKYLPSLALLCDWVNYYLFGPWGIDKFQKHDVY